MGRVSGLLELIQVRDCGMTKVRIGNQCDGGYIAYKELCDMSPAVYSVGVGTDVGFELDWASRYPACQFELYDPTIDRLPQDHERFTFHRHGIGKYETLYNVKQDSTLKVDIEWNEWDAFENFRAAELQKFSQVLVEFHILHMTARNGLSPYFTRLYADVVDRINGDLFTWYKTVMQRLLCDFMIFHIHANNSLPLMFVDGSTFPPLLEVSLVRRDLVKYHTPTKAKFPVEGLDFPNKTDRPDVLYYYPFTGS